MLSSCCFTDTARVVVVHFADDHTDRSAEDSTVTQTGARGTQDRPVQRVWRRLPSPPDGNVCAGRSLARVYLVRCTEVGETDVIGPLPMMFGLYIALTLMQCSQSELICVFDREGFSRFFFST